MKVFEIVKTVLDEEYENIFPEAKRDAKINNALTELGTAYNRVKIVGAPIYPIRLSGLPIFTDTRLPTLTLSLKRLLIVPDLETYLITTALRLRA